MSGSLGPTRRRRRTGLDVTEWTRRATARRFDLSFVQAQVPSHDRKCAALACSGSSAPRNHQTRTATRRRRGKECPCNPWRGPRQDDRVDRCAKSNRHPRRSHESRRRPTRLPRWWTRRNRGPATGTPFVDVSSVGSRCRCPRTAAGLSASAAAGDHSHRVYGRAPS